MMEDTKRSSAVVAPLLPVDDDNKEEELIPPHVQALMTRLEKSLTSLVFLSSITYMIGWVAIFGLFNSSHLDNLDIDRRGRYSTFRIQQALILWQACVIFCIILSAIATFQSTKLYRDYRPWKELVKRTFLMPCVGIYLECADCFQSVTSLKHLDDLVAELPEPITNIFRLLTKIEIKEYEDEDEDEDEEMDSTQQSLGSSTAEESVECHDAVEGEDQAMCGNDIENQDV